MNFMKISLVTLLSVCLDFCCCQYYTSSFEIEKLLETEKKLLDGLNGYFKRQQKKGLTFDEHVLNFVKQAGQRNRETNRDHDYDNPLTTYHILKRAVQDWSKLKENLTCNAEDEHSECPLLTGADVINVVLRENNGKWPTDLDLKLAVDAILNVQNVYNISIETFTQGKLGNAVVQPLDADDIFFIANAAKDSGMTYEAVTWFEYLVQNFDGFSARDFSLGTLHRRLATTYFEHGMQNRAVTILEEFSSKDPNDKGVARDLQFLKTAASKGNKNEPVEVLRFAETTKKTEERLKYEHLCRSALQGPDSLDARLRCYLRPLHRTYGVIKTEVLATRPRIEMIYEVISQNEAETIQSKGEKSFGKFHAVLPLKEKSRTSAQALISGPICESTNKKIIANLTSRLEEITNFEMYPINGIGSSQCYQVINEGLGSLQNFAIDAWPKDQFPIPFAGNRLATIMIQLSDIQIGGQIVFPRINLTVPVVKGSAVMWWNLKRDGLPDTRSIHINCPTVVGSNWYAVKHILYSNQIFRRSCETR